MNAVIEQLESNGRAIVDFARGIGEREARWKPKTGAWSIVEIICHLADEEVEDFRTRVQRTLDDPAQDWPPIDPEGVAIARAYEKQDFRDSIARFERERALSLAWLGGQPALDDPRWLHEKKHPQGGLRAGDVLVSWAAHDLLHLRQMVKRRYEYLCDQTARFDAAYAGSW